MRTAVRLSQPIRTVLQVAVVVAVAMSGATPASAHGDVILVDRALEVAPRSTVSFDGELHYHRVVGVVRSGVDITVRLVRTTDGAVAFESGPGHEIRLNTLIRCCDERAWTRYTLTIRNDTEKPATGHADVRLVHDDLAVMAYQAEEGTRESVVIIGGIWLALLFASRRSRRPLGRAPLALGALSAVVIALAAYGAARYGGGVGPGALVAALSDVPVLPTNPIVSRAALLLLLFGIAWSWIIARWAGSHSGAPHAVIGSALAATVAAVALAMVLAYGETGMPLALTVAALLPVTVVMAVRYVTR